MPMTLVSTVTVGTNLPTQIQWTGIPSTGKDLVILISARASNFNGNVTFNNVSGTDAYREFFGSGSSVSGGNGSGNGFIFITSLYEPRDFNGTNNTTNHFSNSRIYVSNYAGSTAKRVSSESAMEFNTTESYISINTASWAQTAAISSVELKVSGGGTFNQDSTASLYIIS